MEKRHYAIYGGSFDPIHIGHVALADSAVKECGIDKLIFMPAHMSPFKQDRKTTDGMDRCGMIEKVLKYNKAFCLSRYELNKGGPSYTIETLKHWSGMLDGKLSFVLGFDSAMQVDTWFEGPEILINYHLITALRPDTDTEAGLKKIEFFRKEYGAEITVMDMEPVDASSTEIRDNVREGRSISGLVLPEVEEYIIEHQLYR
ncbi:MAG: nicotinate (nicotinamide) nucleotide adenylyltransferase [Mogibacterium sp.]|nr:nicotinate (nicotinamide) nucleotide adenylyltransferase [Mogibacterium sp.]